MRNQPKNTCTRNDGKRKSLRRQNESWKKKLKQEYRKEPRMGWIWRRQAECVIQTIEKHVITILFISRRYPWCRWSLQYDEKKQKRRHGVHSTDDTIQHNNRLHTNIRAHKCVQHVVCVCHGPMIGWFSSARIELNGEKKRWAFMPFSSTHKCTHHPPNLCYNVTRNHGTCDGAIGIGLHRHTATNPFLWNSIFWRVRTNKKENKLSRIITWFHLLTAHSIQFQTNP